MNQKALFQLFLFIEQQISDHSRKLDFWLRVYLLDHKGRLGEEAYKKIVDLITPDIGAEEMLNCWIKIWLTAPLSSLSARAKSEIMTLIIDIDLMFKGYCSLPKFNVLKSEISTFISNCSKETDFSYEQWKRFYEMLEPGDQMESFALWGMSRQAHKGGDILKGLEVYGMTFRLSDFEDKVRKSIIKTADSVDKKLFVYEKSPKGSRLEDEITTSIVKSLSGLKEMFSVYLLLSDGSDLKSMLRDTINHRVADLENQEKMLRFWIFSYSKLPEGDEMKKDAFSEIKAICNSAGKRALGVLRDITGRFLGTELGIYAKQKIAEFAKQQTT